MGAPWFPADRAVLRFEGVDSCFAVWLNGTPLGDGKGSRLPTEFDIADVLHNLDTGPRAAHNPARRAGSPDEGALTLTA